MSTATPAVTIEIRPATAADASEITDIYNQGIRSRLATFETRERTIAEVWFDTEEHAEAAGFTRFRRLDVEHSVNAFYEVRP